MEEKGEIVVDYAKIGCTYGQRNTSAGYPYSQQLIRQKYWDKRFLRVDHTHCVQQHGTEAAHNHDAVPLKNIPRFTACYSPNYISAVKALMKSNPEKEMEYQIALGIACDQMNLKGTKTVPCLLELLDTWFEYSDVEVSTRYEKLANKSDKFKEKLQVYINKVSAFAKTSMDDARDQTLKSIMTEMNETINNDSKMKQLVDKYNKKEEFYDGLKEKYNTFKKAYGFSFTTQIKDLLDEIIILGDDYHSKMQDLSDALDEYVNSWDTFLRGFGKAGAEEYLDYRRFFKSFSSEVKEVREASLLWEEQTDNLLLTSSFLVCRLGGRIEFATSGAEHKDYCNKLIIRLRETFEQLAESMDSVLTANSVFGAIEEESDLSVTSSSITAKKMNYALLTGGDLILAEGTNAVEIWFKSKGYADARDSGAQALLAFALLAPISKSVSSIQGVKGFFAATAFFIVEMGVTYQLIDKDPEADTRKDAADALVSTISYITDTGKIFQGKKISPNKALANKAISKASEIYSILSTIGSLLYVPVEWISEIEVTVVTDYFAHTMKADLDENCELVGEFKAKTKTKVDYYCDGGRAIVDEESGEIYAKVDEKIINAEEQNAQQSQGVVTGKQLENLIENNISGDIK